MKNDPMDRLLAAAARGPSKPLPSEVPWKVEARVLAAWRAQGAEALAPWMGVLRHALAASFVIVAASLVLYIFVPIQSAHPVLSVAENLITTSQQVWP